MGGPIGGLDGIQVLTVVEGKSVREGYRWYYERGGMVERWEK